VNGGETNYVMATLGLFLSIYNLFLSLLQLLMAFSANAIKLQSFQMKRRP